MDADYDVIDQATGSKWMLIDTVGGLFSKDLKYYLKYRAHGSEKSEVLGAAEMENYEDFKGVITDSSFKAEWDSDSDGGWSDDSGSDDEVLELTTKVKGKWK